MNLRAKLAVQRRPHLGNGVLGAAARHLGLRG
jgi:hypothetical protein